MKGEPGIPPLFQDSRAREEGKGVRGGRGDALPGQTLYLPSEVTQVPRETVRSFAHHKKVGTYLLGRPLGEGSFAKVKEGLHLTTGEKVAIKVIDKKRARTDRYVRKNLRREGRLLQQIRHSHVIQLLEVMETEHSYYLVTEFCAGGDLMNYITKRRRLDEKEAKKFIRQIVSAVDYLHRLGIIHRDLKIENLLLDENKNIKLIDFGLSNTIKVSTAPESIAHAQEYLVTQCGSPAYAAPELLNHQKYGLPVDVWSIGVNMYAMLTGSLPFTVDPFNIRTLYNKMMAGHMNPLPPGLSPEAKDLLGKFLRADPELRLTITQALRHPWLAEGRNKPTQRSPFPNKLSTSDLSTEILKHMSENLDFRLSETIRFVVGNVPSSACATYHLFHRKLQRHRVAQDVQGRACSVVESVVDQETTTPTDPSAPDKRITQPECDGSAQKETLTKDTTPVGRTVFALTSAHDPPPSGQGHRKSLVTTKTSSTAAAAATRPTQETNCGKNRKLSLFSIDPGHEDPHASTKENRDSTNRQRQTPTCSRPAAFHRPKANSSISTARPVALVRRSSLRSSHLHPVTGPRRRSRTSPPTTPARTNAGTKPSTLIAATLLSSGLSGYYTRRERTLLPLRKPPVLTRKEVERQASKEAGQGRDLEAVVKEGQGRRKGILVLQETHPAASTPTVTNSGPRSTENGFASQRLLQKRFKNERCLSTQARTNVRAEVSEEVIQVSPIRGTEESYSKRPVSPQTVPAIPQGVTKRPRNETLENLPEAQSTKNAAENLRAEEHLDSSDQRQASVEMAAQCTAVSQSVVSSSPRDLQTLPVICNGVATPR